MRRGATYKAFGEEKTVREWLSDERCVVETWGALNARFREGRMSHEEVITRPLRVDHDGLSRHPIRGIWKNMISRCIDPKDESYSYYGGRGIGVCREWRLDYLSFCGWALLNGWEPGLVIDREDNDGDYTPGNCRFVTRKENMRNTRRNHIIEAFGERKCLSEWAEDSRCEVSANTLCYRLSSGLREEDAITLPRFGMRSSSFRGRD